MDLRIKGSDYTVFNTYCLLLTNEKEWQLLSQKNILVMEVFCYNVLCMSSTSDHALTIVC